MPNVESTLVKFTQGEPATYKKLVKHIQDYVDGECVIRADHTVTVGLLSTYRTTLTVSV